MKLIVFGATGKTGRHVVDGMTRHRVDRLVVLSAAGAGESWRQIPWLARLLFMTLLRNIHADHEAQEEVVKASALDWTIVRAAILNDQPASGDCTAGNTGTVGRIGRADLADFLVGQVKDDAWRKQAVSVTNRPGSRACR